MEHHSQRVSTLVRRFQQIRQRLPHQDHFVGQPHISPDPDESGPVGWMDKVLSVLDRLLGFRKRPVALAP